ncbi:MAG: AraC family transcriptional regulator ligand-binding domain-containing protein, partial [Oleibacter sp.]|nr:AraC family transcriptional regulator ligand-binding domain-containing protein [Thalassolituus sp.]
MTQRTLGKGEFRISSDYLILLAELAFEYGISTQDLLQNSDLSGDFLLRPDLPIGHESALLIIDNYCRRAPKESALAFGRRMTFSKHGALGFAAQYSQSIDDAAETVLRYIATRVQLFDLERQRDNDVRQLFIRNKVPNSAAIE